MRGLAVLLALAPAQALLSKTERNPVSQVVKLMEHLVKQLEGDAETEQSLFKDFECWCTRTDKDIGARVETNKQESANVKAQIDELDAMLARYADASGDTSVADKNAAADGSQHFETDEHERHEKKIMKLKNELKELEDRQTEADDNYQGSRKEYDDAITALGTALEQLSPAAGLIHFSTKVRLAIEKGASTLNDDADVELVDKMMLLSKDAKQPVNSKFSDANYDPAQQKKVHSLVKRIKEQFELERKNLNLNYYGNEDGEKKESAENGEFINFVNLVKNKQEEIDTTVDALNLGAEEKAAKELKLKGLQAQHEALEAGITEDEGIIADAAAECEEKTTLHNKNMVARSDEIAGLHKVINFLMDPDNRDKTLKAYEFIQVKKSSRKVAIHKTSQMLEATAAKTGDRKLARLALRASTKDDAIQEVIDACKDMKDDLGEDQKEDRRLLTEYTGQRKEDAKNAKEKAIEIDDLNAAITNSQALIQTKEEEQATMRDQMKQMLEELNTAQELRTKENAENTELEQSFNDGAHVIDQAVQMMVDEGLVPALIQQDPDRTANDKKNTGFAPEEYGTGAEGEKKGLHMTLKFIAEDLVKSAETTAAEEKEASENFGKYKGDMQTAMTNVADGVFGKWEAEGLKSLERPEYAWSDVPAGTYFDAQKAIDDENVTIKEAETDRQTKGEEMNTLVQAIKDISEQADFLAIHFDTRKANRETEKEGLNKCIEYLSKAASEFA